MLIGVTGQIGVGKSELCHLFEEFGARILDADKIGKSVSESPEILKKLENKLRANLRTPAGKMSRPKIASVVFSDSTGKALETLNKIVHPELVRRLKSESARLIRKNPDRPVVIDAALLPQWKDITSSFDLIALVTAPEKLRLVRLKRRGVSAEDALARIKNQLPLTAYDEICDVTIVNDGYRKSLRKKARSIWNEGIATAILSRH